MHPWFGSGSGSSCLDQLTLDLISLVRVRSD